MHNNIVKQYKENNELIKALKEEQKIIRQHIIDDIGKNNRKQYGDIIAYIQTANRTTLDKNRLIEELGADYIEQFIKEYTQTYIRFI